MQRATSETEAANGALAHVRHPPIASIDERRAVAIACRTRFADTRDALLRDYPWNFATAWVVPAADPRPALGPLKIRYPLPEDCLRVRRVVGLESDAWAVEAANVAPGEEPTLVAVLVSNAAAPHVEYTRRVENPTLWDALFLEIFQLMLGARIAPLIARNAGLAAELEGRARALLKPARRVDAQEKARSDIPRRSTWIDARRGWNASR